MPQRFLRPGITNSELWNGVSWPAQSLFIRLLTLVDDYGRCDGRTPVILGNCFSMWNSLNPDQCCNLQQVEQMLQQLHKKRLVDVYQSEGKTVLQISQWQERLREGVKEKWPSKTGVAATCSNLLPSSPSSPPSSPPTPTPSAAGKSVRANVLKHGEESKYDWLSRELSALYNRPDRPVTDYSEQSLMSEVSRRPDAKTELREITSYRSRLAPKDRRFFPQSVMRLLSGWQEVLDRARNGNGVSDSETLLMVQMKEACRK